MTRVENRTANRWFRMVKQCLDPRLRIICFPHAGGSASFFRPWADFVPDGVELLAVRYPGREDRILDPLARTMEELADPIAAACPQYLDASVAFFGHSMGASVAYEVALRMQQKRSGVLAGLFVSGRPAPGHESDRGLADATDDELIVDIGQQGGTDSETFAHPELRELILPAIRADYRLVSEYRAPTSHGQLGIPVTAYYGDEDAGLNDEAVAAWSSVTASTFTSRAFQGGHFYLVNHVEEMLEHLVSRCRGGHLGLDD